MNDLYREKIEYLIDHIEHNEDANHARQMLEDINMYLEPKYIDRLEKVLFTFGDSPTIFSYATSSISADKMKCFKRIVTFSDDVDMVVAKDLAKIMINSGYNRQEIIDELNNMKVNDEVKLFIELEI